MPVSGEFGKGEYARSLAIAEGARERWPGAGVLFILSRAAPYAASAPVPKALLDSSPTFHTPEVVDIINDWHPDVVIFDNAGRTAQLRAAKRAGARVVYISSRARQRRKAFRLRWMSLIDEHWIAYPRFVAGEFTLAERLKLRFMGRPMVRYLDVILARPRSAGHGAVSEAARTADGYVLLVPGGGTGHPGAQNAVDQFFQAAEGIAASGVETVFVGRAPGRVGTMVGAPAQVDTMVGAPTRVDTMVGAPAQVDAIVEARVPGREDTIVGAPAQVDAIVGAPGREDTMVGVRAPVQVDRISGARAPVQVDTMVGARAPGDGAIASGRSRLRSLESLPQSELGEWMRGASLIVTNGGSTLLQAIACGKPCIAVPIAGDQAQRILRCESAGVAIAAPLNAAAMITTATELLRDEPRVHALVGRTVALGLEDGIEVALRALTALISTPQRM